MRAWFDIRFLFLVPALPSIISLAQNIDSLQVPKEIENSQIDDKPGSALPLDVEITDQDGHKRRLAYYFSPNDSRPKLITMGYYGCSGLCSIVQNALVEVLKKTAHKAGNDYVILSFTIDERENVDLAKAKQASYLAALGESNPSAWNFHVMKESEARRLADALGFNYVYDKKGDQFAHGAGIFVISPKAVLSRTLFGISYSPTDMKLALSEAAEGKFGSFVDRVLLSCFHYDPDAHRYGIYVFGVMRLGGIVTILILGAVLLVNFRNERKQKQTLV